VLVEVDDWDGLAEQNQNNKKVIHDDAIVVEAGEQANGILLNKTISNVIIVFCLYCFSLFTYSVYEIFWKSNIKWKYTTPLKSLLCCPRFRSWAPIEKFSWKDDYFCSFHLFHHRNKSSMVSPNLLWLYSDNRRISHRRWIESLDSHKKPLHETVASSLYTIVDRWIPLQDC
jgi:hypothetical protein